MKIATTPALRIGEFAAGFGLNTKTIRYYESIGLLPKPARTESGYRLYGSSDQERLSFVRKARAVGLTLDEIGEMLALRPEGCQRCSHFRLLVGQKLRAIDDQLQALHAFREELMSLQAEANAATCADDEDCGIIEHHQLIHDFTDISKVSRPLSPLR